MGQRAAHSWAHAGGDRSCAGGCAEADGSRKGAIHLAEHIHQVPKEVSGDLWHSHHKCDCTITCKAMGHWATLNLSQMLWGHSNMSQCVRKNFSQAEKFFPSRLQRSIAGATRQPKKNVSEAGFFWGLVGRSCDAFIRSRREKTVQPAKTCFLANFFLPTAFALACHGFANAVTLRLALGML